MRCLAHPDCSRCCWQLRSRQLTQIVLVCPSWLLLLSGEVVEVDTVEGFKKELDVFLIVQ